MQDTYAGITITARAVVWRVPLRGFGRIEPLASIWLRAPIPAMVTSIAIKPGQAIKAGSPLYTLGGPGITARLTATRTQFTAAQEQYRLAKDSAASARRRYPAFTDRTRLDTMLAKLANAKTREISAQADLQRLERWVHRTSPISGHITTLEIQPGTQLTVGMRTLEIQPDHALWLKTILFTQRSIPIGQTGWFSPLSGGPAILIRVMAIAPALTSAGARLIWFAPLHTQPANWIVGRAGRVMLKMLPRPAVQVPAAALILARGHWWVLIDQAGKLIPRQIRLAPDGADTGIVLQGLRAGEHIIVRGSYRLFHRDFSLHYTPLD